MREESSSYYHKIYKIVVIKRKIENIEYLISLLSSEKNARMIKENFENLTEEGNFHIPKMWSLKKRINSQYSDVPTAKRDASGNLVTNQKALVSLYRNEYIHRLSPKSGISDLSDYFKFQEDLFNLRYRLALNEKTEEFQIKEVLKVRKNLKKNKARDDNMMSYELFMPKFAGIDIYKSLTMLFNSVKRNMVIPEFFQTATITSFYKNRGCVQEMTNQRGVFNLPKVRGIFDKMIYQRSYEEIDRELSCSNVGGRKERSIRDHLFVITAIINDAINGDGGSLYLQGVDLIKCFDEMDYVITYNDLFDVKISDDRFCLLSKLNEKCLAKVKTPCGPSDKFVLNRPILQGSVWAPIKCSTSVDSLARDCYRQDQGAGLYLYKKSVLVPSLSMVDDIMGVTTCGAQAIELNSIINSKVEMKKLRLSSDKSYMIHICKKKKECSYDLKVHKEKMKEVQEAMYLGQVISNTGSMNPTIQSRKLKGIGIISQIMSLLNSVSLGRFYVQIGLILRESMFVNGILTACESWPKLTERNIKTLEECDAALMRKIFSSHSKVNKVLLYLETRKLPLRYIIVKRRLMFHWHILTRSKEELILRVYEAQKCNPSKSDFCLVIEEIKERFEISFNDEEISHMSKSRYKDFINKQVEKIAFQEMLNIARNQSKCFDILRSMNSRKLEIQDYLKYNKFMKEYQQVLFSLWNKTYPFKINF